MNKKKIFNDPVYGFINITSDILFDLIEHPYFQRLRRIRQLGLTNLVYPGANHTRFQHAIGTLYLMDSAINVIRSKGYEITEEEDEAVKIAILLHDIGHGPFSHTLEHSIIEISHEIISEFLMQRLNIEFEGKLSLAIDIFNNRYHKKFLHELVSSQLDMDRLDYLKRDSFFTGVTEGVIGSDRIIKMLNVHDDHLVVEAKGIYSIEKFLVARRLMYWQVYLHKTVLAAEHHLKKILQRAKYLSSLNYPLFATPSLDYFLKNKIDEKSFSAENERLAINLHHFSRLDDTDIISSIKAWEDSDDEILSILSKNFINRQLFKIEIQNTPFEKDKIDSIKQSFYQSQKLDPEYFVFSGSVENNAYNVTDDKIFILSKSGDIVDITEASDIFNISVITKTTTKFFLCYPK